MGGFLHYLFRPVNRHTTHEIGELMATVEEIRDQLASKLDEVKSSLTAALDRVAADVESLKNEHDIPAEAFTPITDGLDEVKSSLDALDPVPEVVEAPPVEETPAEETPPEETPPATG